MKKLPNIPNKIQNRINKENLQKVIIHCVQSLEPGQLRFSGDNTLYVNLTGDHTFMNTSCSHNTHNWVFDQLCHAWATDASQPLFLDCLVIFHDNDWVGWDFWAACLYNVRFRYVFVVSIVRETEASDYGHLADEIGYDWIDWNYNAPSVLVFQAMEDRIALPVDTRQALLVPVSPISDSLKNKLVLLHARRTGIHNQAEQLLAFRQLHEPTHGCTGRKLLGRPIDGGYVVCGKPTHNNLVILSFGGGPVEYSFEQAATHYFDASVKLWDQGLDKTTEYRSGHRTITFTRGQLSARQTNRPDTLSLAEIVKQFPDDTYFIIKMDIEHWEWEMIEQIPPAIWARVPQLIVELHYRHPDVLLDYYANCLRQLHHHFYLCLVVGNNVSSSAIFSHAGFPSVVEMCWVNKTVSFEQEPCAAPDALAHRNDPLLPDIQVPSSQQIKHAFGVQ